MSNFTPDHDSNSNQYVSRDSLSSLFNANMMIAQYDDILLFVNNHTERLLATAARLLETQHSSGYLRTKKDLPRFNLLVTQNSDLHWMASENAGLFLDELNVTLAPDFENEGNVSLSALTDSLLETGLAPNLLQYFLRGLNQEALYSPNVYWAEYQVALMQLYPHLSDEISQKKITYCCQLDVKSQNEVNFYLHAFYQSATGFKRLSTTKVELKEDYHGEIHQRKVKTDFIVESDLFFFNTDVHLTAQYELLKKTALTPDASLANLMRLIDLVINQKQQYLRCAELSKNRLYVKKASALNEVAMHAIGFVVAKSCKAPAAVLKQKQTTVKSSLLRNRVILSEHQNLVWRLWNTICALFSLSYGESLDLSATTTIKKQSGLGLFKPARTSSLKLARNCTLACRS